MLSNFSNILFIFARLKEILEGEKERKKEREREEKRVKKPIKNWYVDEIRIFFLRVLRIINMQS